MKKLVIFDLDGTLLNTIDDITASLNKALNDVSLAPITIEEAKYFVGSGVDILIDRLLHFELKDDYNEKKDLYFEKLKKAYCEDYSKNNAVLTKPYPGIIELIHALKSLGIRVAVLSNKPHLDTLKVIEYYFGSIDYFDLVMGKKDYNRIKPYPDGALEVIQTLNDRFSNKYKLADIAYVGDTNVDIETAKNLGCESIACTWGFRKIEELQEASYIASSPEEVYQIITRKLDGVIVLNKSKDISSNKIINDIKHTLSKHNFPISKIGHAGTLDPLATGVMVVLVNGATKLSDYLMCEEKEYICEICFGESYDTLDITGKLIDKILLTKEHEQIINETIDECLKSFLGESLQTPPMFSSIKQNGVKLYNLARSGETIEREKRLIDIKEINRVSDIRLEDGKIYFSYHTTVSKGTYIRSLCEDIGKYYGLPCAMSNLIRTRSGHFKIDDALTIDEIIDKNNNHSLTLISMKEAMNNIDIPKIEINEYKMNRVKHGQQIRFENQEKEIALFYQGELIAIYENTYQLDEASSKYSFKVKTIWN